MNDILDKLDDLLKQATTESHFYVAACCREAMAEIINLRADLAVARHINRLPVVHHEYRANRDDPLALSLRARHESRQPHEK